jgi:lactate permease
MWSHVYDPLGNPWLSTLCAALPVIVLLGALGIFHIKAHIAALMGLITSLVVAIGIFGMPGSMALSATLMGAANGLLPIGWIILNVIFLYQLTERKGQFAILRESITGVTQDRRLQLLLIAFCFGAFFEGAGGFGTPVAVTGAMLIGLGFSPLAASGLSLIANTAPVAYGAGHPITTLAKVTGIDVMLISSMVGRQMTIFAVIVPFWLLIAFCGWKNTLRIWPAALVAGLSFAIPQLIVSNTMGPELVAVIASVCSIAALVLFLKVWHPQEVYTSTAGTMAGAAAEAAGKTALQPKHGYSTSDVIRAWLPWLILSVLVFAWGSPNVKKALDAIFTLNIHWPGLDNLVQKMPPVVAKPHIEAAVYSLNILSTTGTGILVAGILSGLIMGYRPSELVKVYGQTFWSLRYSLITIVAMLALGYLTRYSGVDITLGLAFSHTGVLYPSSAPCWAGWAWHSPVPTPLPTSCLAACKGIGHPVGSVSGADDRCQLGWRCDGQDDRRPIHRGGFDSNPVLRQGRRDPALRVLPLAGAGLPGWLGGHRHGLPAAVYIAGIALK